MTTIRNAQFDFGLSLSDERASSISRRAMEILQERLAARSDWTGMIGDVEIGPVELPGGEVETEQAARQIAGAVYAGIGRNRRG